jgi:hypothetical protein
MVWLIGVLPGLAWLGATVVGVVLVVALLGAAAWLAPWPREPRLTATGPADSRLWKAEDAAPDLDGFTVWAIRGELTRTTRAPRSPRA